jgi:hypothetical protein
MSSILFLLAALTAIYTIRTSGSICDRQGIGWGIKKKNSKIATAIGYLTIACL